jgi:ketosteroid isomerase-like protein
MPRAGERAGAEVDVNHWVVVTFRNGKIVREQWFVDRA